MDVTVDPTSPQATAEPDAVLAAAVEIARVAAVTLAGDEAGVGEYLGVRADPVVGAEDGAGGLVATHAFAAALPGYTGWHWAISVARADGDGDVTVDETVLLPGDGALLAPAWVPWEERVRPGDLAPGDLLPPPPGDPRLVPAYTFSDDPAVETVAFELGQGREQVMSRDGRLDAAQRWFDGDRGPDAPMARQAPAACGTCGYFLPLAGSLAAGFGVCGNEVTDCDGQVVSVGYGCGAHSSVRAEPNSPDVVPVVYDDGEEITAVRSEPEPAEQAAEPAVAEATD